MVPESSPGRLLPASVGVGSVETRKHLVTRIGKVDRLFFEEVVSNELVILTLF